MAATSEAAPAPAATGSASTTRPATTQVETLSTKPPTTKAPTTEPPATKPPTAEVGGAAGYVRASPTCPVERVDRPCPPQPVTGAHVEAHDQAGQVVAETDTDSTGHFAVSLAPGSYTLVAATGTIFPRCDPLSLTVRTGQPASADISCDTGIR
jgi:Carboxypeptidase regulatory-like domain